MKVLDVYYHRGTTQNRVVVSDPSINDYQIEMTQVIQGYMGGKLTKDEFVGKLAEHNI